MGHKVIPLNLPFGVPKSDREEAVMADDPTHRDSIKSGDDDDQQLKQWRQQQHETPFRPNATGNRKGRHECSNVLPD